MLVPMLTFALGLASLAAGGELLFRSPSRLASGYRVSRLLIGLTVVAFGTSAPEADVSLMAALNGASDLAMGNVVSSNILNVNVLFTLGLSAVVIPLAVSERVIRFDVPFLLAISVLCVVLGLDGTVSRRNGLVLLAVLVVYTVLSYRAGMRAGLGGFGPPAGGACQ